MNKHETYTFRIDAFTPATLPMARLAEYMAKLAELLGEQERVHFVRLRKGSAILEHNVEQPAVQKVRERVTKAKRPALAPDDIRRSMHDLNEMLRKDNAVGDLSRGGAKILLFRGREEQPPERIGPVVEAIQVDGLLVRIGGKDASAHATILNAEGETVSCVVSRQLAMAMGHHLFAPIRVRGQARWERTEEGKWEILSVKAEDFQALQDVGDLQSAVSRLQSIEGSEWSAITDPLSLLSELRGSDKDWH